MGYFKNDQHAWSAGVLVGSLIRKGISVRPQLDAAGNTTDEVAIYLSNEDDMVVVFVKVLPLPDPDD